MDRQRTPCPRRSWSGHFADEERIVERAAPTLRADEDDGLHPALAWIVKAGASVRVPVQTEPHEYRAMLEDRNDARLVISQKCAA